MSWQPIETAPKDGATILLRRGTQVVAGFWTAQTYVDGVYHWLFLNEDNRNVEFTANGLIPVNAFHSSDPPTHWMPIPTPPKDTQ